MYDETHMYRFKRITIILITEYNKYNIAITIICINQ